MHQQDEETKLLINQPHDEKDSSSSSFLQCLKGGLLPHGSIASAGFNLAAATLGAGTLGLPAAMQASGWLLGSIVLIVAAAGTVLAIRYLIQLSELTDCHTYEALSRKFIGPWFEKVTAALIVFFCWGATVMYVKGMQDILQPLTQIQAMPHALQGPWGVRLITGIFWLCFMMPLSLMKEINSLRYASLVGMAATVVLGSAVVAHAIQDGSANAANNLVAAQFTTNMALSLTTFCFAYCCQTNAFEIYAELKDKSPNRMTLAAGISMTCCTAIYIIVGIAGFADFGAAVRSNILSNYKSVVLHVPYLIAAFLCISITLTMAFPICIFPTRDATLQVLGYKDAYTTPTKVRVLVCVIYCIVSLIAGLAVPDMGVLFGILGGICGATVAYSLPGLYYLMAHNWDRKACGTANFIVCWSMLVLGTVIGVAGTLVVILQTAGVNF